MILRKKTSNKFRGNIIEFRKEIKNGLLALWNNENNGDNMNSKLTIIIKGTTMGNNRSVLELMQKTRNMPLTTKENRIEHIEVKLVNKK